MNITFVNCLLTTPQLEGQLTLKWEELCELIATSFSSDRIAEFRRLRALADLDNLRAHWSHGQFNPCGNWTGDLQVLDGAPTPFFQRALEIYSDDEGLKHTSNLMVDFFLEDVAQFGETSWISRYFRSEMAMRWLLANLRSSNLGKKPDSELSSRDSEEGSEFLKRCLLLAREEFPHLFLQLEEVYQLQKRAPLDLQRALCQWRLDLIEELAARSFWVGSGYLPSQPSIWSA